MTNSSPWFFDGPNRNRWFTVLNFNGIDGPSIDGLPFLISWWIFPWRSVNVTTRSWRCEICATAVLQLRQDSRDFDAKGSNLFSSRDLMFDASMGGPRGRLETGCVSRGGQ